MNVLLGILAAATLSTAALADEPARSAAPVVFVCEHGNVKSLIGATLFDQVARERGLPYRAVSRGVHPETSVPTKIADALRADGIEVADYKPQQLTPMDVSGALRVVSIGADLSAFSLGARRPIEEWTDVPPATADYAASRAALLRHIGRLLDEIEGRR